MNWNEILVTLGGVTAINAVVGFLAKLVIQHSLNRNLEQFKNDLKSSSEEALAVRKTELELKRDEIKAKRAADAAENDRIRQEGIRWGNQVVGAIDDLRFRIKNIIEGGSAWALSKNGQATRGQSTWSIEYAYFLPSTVFLFSQYFCWIRLLEEEGSFELFRTLERREELFRQVRKTEQNLSSWPFGALKRTSDDFQVFRFQQKGLGGALVVARGHQTGCMRYSEFLEKWNDPIFSVMVKPMRQFLEDIQPGTCRWERLELMINDLNQLRKECDQLLSFTPTFRPEPPGF